MKRGFLFSLTTYDVYYSSVANLLQQVLSIMLIEMIKLGTELEDLYQLSYRTTTAARECIYYCVPPNS